MIAVIGTGALASLFAARLAPHTDVVMIGSWQPALDAIQSKGLTLLEPDGSRKLARVPATEDASSVPPADSALLLVKSYQTSSVLSRVQRSLREEGVVVTLQNGAGNLELLQTAFGGRATAGITSLGATLEEPGVVRHGGDGPIHLAPPASSQAGAAFERLLKHLENARFEVHLSPNVEGLIWGKLAINAGINPLTCVLGVRNGFLLEHEACRRLVQLAAREVAAVADAQSITLPYGDAGEAAIEVARRTADNLSSMLQDRLKGRPTEIEAICGTTVRVGAEHNVPTPVNSLLLSWVRHATTTEEVNESEV